MIYFIECVLEVEEQRMDTIIIFYSHTPVDIVEDT